MLGVKINSTGFEILVWTVIIYTYGIKFYAIMYKYTNTTFVFWFQAIAGT